MNQLDRGSRGSSFFLSSSMNKSTQVLMLIAVAWLTACGGGDPNAVSSPTSTQSSQAQLANNPMMAKALGASVIDATPSDLVNQAVNLQDAIAILKLIVGLDVNAGGQPVTSYQLFAADFDGNGKVELADAIGVLKHVVGLDSPSPKWVFFNTYGSAPVISDKLNPGLPPELRAVIDGSTAAQISLVPVLRGDVVGSAMNYSWTLGAKPAGSSAVLAGAVTATPTFTADLAGDYVATLRVTDGSSNIASTTVTMTAGASKYDISGMASGINANFPLTLKNSSGDTLLVSANGTFVFPNQQAYGTNYSITLSAQPLGQTCAVVGGTGLVTGPISNLTVTCSEPPYFAEISNAFPSMDYIYTFTSPVQPKPFGAIIANAAVDMLGDGKKQFIFSVSKTWGHSYETQPAQSQIFVFQLINGKSWVDITSKLIPNNFVIPGTVQKFTVMDINGDGKDDIIIETNQDDGRQGGNGSLYGAYSQLLLSQADGTYKLSNFGAFGFWLNTGVGIDFNGNQFFALTGSGDAPQGGEIFKWSNGGLVADDSSFPYLSNLTFEFLQLGGSRYSNGIIETADDITRIQGYFSNGNNSWSDGGTIASPSYPIIANEQYLSWTGSTSTVPILSYKGAYIIGASTGNLPLGDACQIKPSPDADPFVLFGAAINVIKNYVPGQILGDTNIDYSIGFVGAKISSGKLLESTPTIINQSFVPMGTGRFECKDINGDGYTDIIVYQAPSSRNSTAVDASPIIYLNNKDGTFKRSSYYLKQNISTTRSISSENSIMADFDGDGVPDIIIFGGDVGNPDLNPIPDSSGTWKFYRGLKLIEK